MQSYDEMTVVDVLVFINYRIVVRSVSQIIGENFAIIHLFLNLFEQELIPHRYLASMATMTSIHAELCYRPVSAYHYA